ncbi:MAG: hypothetical protein QM640_09215 [Niabella sp.]
MKLSFKAVYNFRPGAMKSFKGAKNVPGLYKAVIALFNLTAPKKLISLEELKNAMAFVSTTGYYKNTLEITDIKQAAQDYGSV